jgi:hypothetical protein
MLPETRAVDERLGKFSYREKIAYKLGWRMPLKRAIGAVNS